MPTYHASPTFRDLHGKLTSAQRELFRVAVRKFVADLESENGFRRGLRVKGVQKMEGVFEMTWAPNGRAMFTYGAEVIAGEPHVEWLYIGDHSILP